MMGAGSSGAESPQRICRKVNFRPTLGAKCPAEHLHTALE